VKQPPGPVHATDCPGTQTSVRPLSFAQPQAPYPVPAALHTWFEMHPPVPVQVIDCPGTQAVAPASVDGAQSHGPYAVPSPLQT
jgi:hypothetical protein